MRLWVPSVVREKDQEIPSSGERPGLEMEIHVTARWDWSPRVEKIQQEENGEGCRDSSSFKIICCSSRELGFSS